MKNLAVVVPVYNPNPELFKKCLDSIIRVNPREIIIVDDWSTDPDVINTMFEYSDKYDNISLFKTSGNSGNDALPTYIGAVSSTSEYICKVDSDDILVSVPKKFRGDAYLANYRTVDTNGNILPVDMRPANEKNFVSTLVLPDLMQTGSIFKRNLFIKCLARDNALDIYTDVYFALMFFWIVDKPQPKIPVRYHVEYANKVTYEYVTGQKGSIEGQRSGSPYPTLVMTIGKFLKEAKIGKDMSMTIFGIFQYFRSHRPTKDAVFKTFSDVFEYIEKNKKG